MRIAPHVPILASVRASSRGTTGRLPRTLRVDWWPGRAILSIVVVRPPASDLT